MGEEDGGQRALLYDNGDGSPCWGIAHDPTHCPNGSRPGVSGDMPARTPGFGHSGGRRWISVILTMRGR